MTNSQAGSDPPSDGHPPGPRLVRPGTQPEGAPRARTTTANSIAAAALPPIAPAVARTITANRSAIAPRLPIAPAIARTITARPIKSRIDPLELHELLEANLQALRALHDEHHRMLQTSLQAIDGICTELRSELRAIGNARAPWVRAMSETRALLFVALRELVSGAEDFDDAMAEFDEPERTR